MKQALSAMLLLPIITVAKEARYLNPGVLGRLKSAWGRLSKLRKTIVIGIAVVAVMISSSILNQGKPDAAWSNFLTMVCTILVFLMWGLYRLSRRSRILVALALSVALNGLGGLRNSIRPEDRYWTGLTPDDSPLFLHDTSTREIYALDVDLP